VWRVDARVARETVAAPEARRIAGAVWEAREEARRVRQAAEAEACSIRDRAAGEVERARAEGVERGRREGLALAAARVARASEEADRLLSGCAAEVLDLAAAMASRILEREVRPGSDAVLAADRALTVLRGRPRATLRASPADLQALEGERGRLGALVGRLRLVPDGSLAPGEVRVEADGSQVDGRFTTLLSELRSAIAEGGE
jgi:flagellar biosynthesis/type III secretory pathway protein FliH